MTHAWLFTGPPGSGRSNAARAFAAALLCERGRVRRVPGLPYRAGGLARRRHPGRHRPVGASGSTRSASWSGTRRCRRPVGAGRSLIIEDADRLTDQAADALLKSIEEPPPRTVWLLCAPDGRGRRADDPVALPGAGAAHAADRGGGRAPAAARRRRRADRDLRRPRVAGPHRPGARAGPRRGDPQPPARGAPGAAASWSTSARA